ncbi:3-isopropylmalate dehydratase large subunit [Orrella daihaiensis]|uniref:3-isopropylmalate dehydratase large subunit n=1 Tax=Orrella daihaiensis TaxID=2782176 RepID=A0ABY4ALN6_9BURK|nr:3-isopropylmalate dehydratase large subunit [Orrella daihaiensis]UOD50005.1 3-isopropylmalate dehydratase large subunit [Orrella daihaiensis]
MSQTLFDKIWSSHLVLPRRDGPSLMYIDRHIVHEGSFHAFNGLRARDLSLRHPEQVFGVPDHYVPTNGRSAQEAANPEIANMIVQFDRNMRWGKVPHFELSDERQGIVHVVGPEQGITLPGMTVVCSDSHTSTHGALGAIAFGIGQSESMHVMATQTLWQTKPRVMRIKVDGQLREGVGAKDIILAIIAKIGAGGAVGYAIEYAGSAIESLGMDGRLTVCNMSIEAGARLGSIAPDDVVFNYLHDKPQSPKGDLWDRAIEHWRSLKSDADAAFDREVTLDANSLKPMVTWGTSPDAGGPIDGAVPDPEILSEAVDRAGARAALDYMGLVPGTRFTDISIDRVFIGSCTNSRLSDLREAAEILRGKKVKVPGIVVPGSGLVKRDAEAEGLHRIFIEAGLEWRAAGCSMCAAMNGDVGSPGERIASTSNRNFVGRQGPGVRTHLMSPAMAAAAAVTGKLTDVRELV